MSYILDALKKSDQQRQRGAAPTLFAAQVTVAATKRPRLVLDSVFVALLLCAGIAVGWLRPWQSDQAVSAHEPAVAPLATPISHPAAQALRAAVREAAEKPVQVQVTQNSLSDTQLAPPPVAPLMKKATPPVAGDEPHPAFTQAATVEPPETTMASPDKKVPDAPADADHGKKVLALSELPASIQQEIPAISISFHVYSRNPKDRRVMINGTMAEQGETLAPGLSLDEITPDGVILGYKEYRFRRGVR